MAEVLEVLHLPHEDGVAEVDVGGGGVEADLDGERAAEGELRLERVRRSPRRRHPWSGRRRRRSRSLSLHDHPAALDPAAALEEEPHRARVEPVLGLEDAGGEGLRRVAREDRAPPPGPRSARSRAPRPRGAPWPRSPSTPCSNACRCASSPGKAGSSAGWMFTMRPGKARTKTGESEAHEAGQAHEVDLVGAQDLDDLGVVGLALLARGGRGRRRGSRPRGRARGRARPRRSRPRPRSRRPARPAARRRSGPGGSSPAR